MSTVMKMIPTKKLEVGIAILWWVFLFVVVVVAMKALSISVHIPHSTTFSGQLNLQ